MDFKFTKPLEKKADSPALSELSSAYEQSITAFEENAKPVSLKAFLDTHKRNQPIHEFQIYHRDYLKMSPGTHKVSIITWLLETLVVPNRKFAPNTVSVTVRNNKALFEVSYDIWENKDSEELWYTFFGGVAQVIQLLMYDTINKKFYWQLIFYNMGFDPRKHLVERAEAESTAEDILSRQA